MTENKAYEMNNLNKSTSNQVENGVKLVESKPTMKTNSRWVILQVIIPFSIWTIIFQLIPGIWDELFGSDRTWFYELNTSPISPPPIVIQTIWPFLNFSLSTYGWYVSYQLRSSRQYQILFFWVQMILKWLYAPLFFELHGVVTVFVMDIFG